MPENDVTVDQPVGARVVVAAPSFSTQKWAFAWYDFANSGYLIIFQTFLFPLFFADVLDKAGFNGSAWWGWAVAISVVAAMVIGPFLGRLSDRNNKAFIFAILVGATFLLSLLTPFIVVNKAMMLIVFFIIFNTCFELSQTIYDSFLPDIAPTEKIKNTVSALAYGFGYFGGVITLLIYFLLNKLGMGLQSILMISACLFLAFSVFPMRVFLRFSHVKPLSLPSSDAPLFERLGINWKTLFIYWIIADVVTAITYFASLFGERDLALSKTTIGALLILMQLLAFPLTMLGSRLANRWGTVKTIRISLLFWLVGLIIVFFSHSVEYLIGAIVVFACVFGTTQSLLRSHYANRIQSGSGEAFGYFAIANKSASFISPALVGLIVTFTGAIRPAFLMLALLVGLSMYLSKFLPK